MMILRQELCLRPRNPALLLRMSHFVCPSRLEKSIGPSRGCKRLWGQRLLPSIILEVSATPSRMVRLLKRRPQLPIHTLSLLHPLEVRCRWTQRVL
jgi:hypothetical protein